MFIDQLEVNRITYLQPYWDDLRIAATATKGGGVSDPDFVKVLDDGGGSTGVYTWGFDRVIEEELFFTAEMPHKWQEGAQIEPHVHWTRNPVGAGTNVVWGLEYSPVVHGGTFPPSTIIIAAPSACSVLENKIEALPVISMVGKDLSTMLLCRIFRDTGNVGDDLVGDALLLEIDFHYTIDTPGSVSQFSKL